MSWYYLKALEGEEPFCHWYGLPARRTNFEIETLKPPTDQEKLLAEIEETLAQSEKLLAQNARFSKKVKKLLGEE